MILFLAFALVVAMSAALAAVIKFFSDKFPRDGNDDSMPCPFDVFD